MSIFQHFFNSKKFRNISNISHNIASEISFTFHNSKFDFTYRRFDFTRRRDSNIYYTIRLSTNFEKNESKFILNLNFHHVISKRVYDGKKEFKVP